MEFIHTLIEPKTLIMTLGTIGVISVIFAETGLLIGFFLAGDSLLFTAGFLASQGYVHIGWLLVGTFIAAVIGDSVGYAFGKRVGPAIFTRENSLFFDHKHIIKAEHFYEKHGKKTIILARFIPIVRTFAPIVAGVGNMHYRTFIIYNIVGGFIWTFGLLLLGFGFGSIIPNADKFILPIIGLIILMSFVPVVWELYKQYKDKRSSSSN